MKRDDFDPVDQAALDRALQLTLDGDDRDRTEQICDKLKSDGWYWAASFCASLQQSASLDLKPWQEPPCDIDADEVETILPEGPRRDHHDCGASKLVKRMLAAGVSLYEPNPLAALEGRRRTTR